VSNGGRQHGASFTYLIETGILMKLGCGIVRVARFHPFVTIVHDKMEKEVKVTTATFDGML
jgi:hypothetical protein